MLPLSASPILPCPCFSEEIAIFSSWSSARSLSPSSSAAWSHLYSTEQQQQETLAAPFLCCRELLRNGVKPGKESFQFVQYTPTFLGPVLALYGMYQGDEMIWDEVPAVFFTGLLSPTEWLAPTLKTGTQFPAWALVNMMVDQLAGWHRGSWHWGSHPCCHGHGFWHTPTRKLEAVMSDYSY